MQPDFWGVKRKNVAWLLLVSLGTRKSFWDSSVTQKFQDFPEVTIWREHMPREGRQCSSHSRLEAFQAQVLDTAVNVPAPCAIWPPNHVRTLYSPPWDKQVPIYLWANKWLVSFYDLGWHIRGKKIRTHNILHCNLYYVKFDLLSFFHFWPHHVAYGIPVRGDWTHAFCSDSMGLNTGLLRKFLICSYLTSFIFVSWFQTQEGKFIQWPPKTPKLSTQYKIFSYPLSGHGWCLCLTLVVKNVSPKQSIRRAFS